MEEQKINVLKGAKNLRLAKEGGWEAIFIHQDLTPKQREARKWLLQEMRENGQWRKGSDDIQRENHQEKTKTREQLKCFYTNANSLVHKIDELRQLVTLRDYDIISVAETWATVDSELLIERFSMYRVDHIVTRGGGVVLYIKENLRSSIDNKLMLENSEDSVWCSVKTNDKRLLIGVCYRSPKSSKENNLKYYQ